MTYSTTVQVRNTLPKLLIDEDDIGQVDSGTELTLTKSAFDVPSILKDGTELKESDGDFTFSRPKTITLDSAASGEYYIATAYYSVSDSDLETIIKQADRIIDDYFAKYDSPSTENKSDWSAWLAASIYLKQYASATQENLDKAKALEKQAMDAMKRYMENTLYSDAKDYPHRKYVVKVNR